MRPGSNEYWQGVIEERLRGCNTAEEKIEAYIRKMMCVPFDKKKPSETGYECIGKTAMYCIVEKDCSGFNEYEKILRRVVKRLRKDGLVIGLGGGFIHRNG